MTQIPLELQYLAKSILWELDAIAKNYMECEDEEDKSAIQVEFQQAVLHFNRLIKKDHADTFPENSKIFTYGVKQYIKIRNKDNWETL